MKAIRLKIIVMACSCLLAAPFFAFGQGTPYPTATSPDNTAMASVSDASVPSLEDLGLPPASNQNNAQDQTTPPNQTAGNAQDQKTQTTPAASKEPSLADLGFTSSQTQPDAQLQARLDKRTHMLKIHQKLGLITVLPMFATVVAGGGAKAAYSHGPGSKIVMEPTAANVDLHAALGSLTAGLYGATAYYAIFAPKIPGTKPVGHIRLHRDLAFIHGPGMILTPILGAMALSQQDKGEKVHGIASAHAFVAWTTVIAYSAAIVSVSWPIKLKFWEHS